jgi:hypothetical protein
MPALRVCSAADSPRQPDPVVYPDSPPERIDVPQMKREAEAACFAQQRFYLLTGLADAEPG